MGIPAVDLNQASTELREIVEEATRSGEVVLTRGGEVVAKVVPLRHPRAPRRPGSARGLVHMAEDFDATPEDFNDYL
jgi:antitoxin (DNA-binding transcriptional repressor) of toxin-antitoxin stability system